LRQEVALQPEQPGVLSLNATLLVDSPSASLARSYSIPLIASAAGVP
jgi:hypothetical protein